MAEPQRVHISNFADIASRYRAFLVPGAVEIQERASFEIIHRRILFDEVHAITLHRARQWWGVIVSFLFAACFLSLALALGSSGESMAAWGFVIVAFLIALPGLLVLALPAQVITLYGQRARARVVFHFRPSKAREWFARLSREIEHAQTQQRPVDATS